MQATSLPAESDFASLTKKGLFLSQRRSRGAPMRERTESAASRPRWKSWFQLAIVGTVLTFAGLIVGSGGLPQIELYPKVEGISEADGRHLDEIKKLGGEANFMERTPRFLGLFGGRDLLSYVFRGKAFDDEALARFVKAYGDRVWGLYLVDTSVTDVGLRHLSSLPHIHDLGLGGADPLFRSGSLPAKITDAGLVHLNRLTTLQNLQLGDLPVTDAGLEAIKDLPNLGGLYLWGTQVKGNGIARLKSLPALAVLYLDRSAINEEALAHLKGATNLQMLSISGVPLTARALHSLKNIPRLTRLNIQGCGLDFEDINEFERVRPTVKLE
jgi:hypothetical protein